MMKYYPIGTVVTLVNGNRPLMIYGRKQIQNESDILWDYVACFYLAGLDGGGSIGLAVKAARDAAELAHFIRAASYLAQAAVGRK